MTGAGRRLGRAAALVAGVLVAVVGPGAIPAGAARDADDPVVDRVVRIPELIESSGLARSERHDGILWSHNDSGDVARIFAIGRDGHAAAVVRLAGIDAVDVEAIQALPEPDGDPLLVIGDIGDNKGVRTGPRGSSDARPELYVIREPARLRDATVPVLTRIRLTYPDGPHDAEALLADPRTRRLYVVTKGLFGGRVYAVPRSVWPGRGAALPLGGGSAVRLEARLVRQDAVPLSLVTDGVIDASGHVFVRSYGTLADLGLIDDLGSGSSGRRASTRLPDQDQGESLTLTAPDASGEQQALIGSEGRDEPIYRVDLPRGRPTEEPTTTTAPSPGGADPTPTARATPRAGTAAAGPADGDGDGDGVGGAFSFVFGGGLVLVMVASGLALARGRRSAGGSRGPGSAGGGRHGPPPAR